jgi:Ankyrin repeats (many copies)
MVQLLLARDDVDVEAVNVEDFWGRTPLWYAVKRGYLEVVELFRSRDTVS